MNTCNANPSLPEPDPMKPTSIFATLLGAALLLASGVLEAASVQLRVAATVQPRVRMEVLRQVPTVTITESDVRRGFVEVGSATRFDLTSNTATQVELAGASEWFSGVRVLGLPGVALELTSSRRAFAMLPAFIHRITADLSFRFRLRPGAGPGTYPWPLALSLTPA